MNTKIDFVHIGLPRTGTTWLQRIGFPSHPEIALVNRDSSPTALAINDVLVELYRGVDNNAVERFRALVDSLDEPHHILGISQETIAGDVWNGDNMELTCNALHDAFPNTKIIICLREQHSMIESMYREYIAEAGTLSPIMFLEQNRHVPIDVDKKLQYHTLVEPYQRSFGANRVFVVFFEDFKKSPVEYARQLYRFIGADDTFEPPSQQRKLSKSHHYLTVAITRHLQRVFLDGYEPAKIAGVMNHNVAIPTRSGWRKLRMSAVYESVIAGRCLDRFFGVIKQDKSLIPSGWWDQHKSIFAESNLKLANCLKVPIADLKARGYVIPQ